MAAHARGSRVWIIGLWAALGAVGGAAEIRAGDRSFEGIPREEAIAWQAALEARRFSPGLLDGIPGPKTEAALRAFQTASGLAVTGAPDEATRRALDLTELRGTTEYTVEPGDEQLVRYCPPDWNERSRQERLLYASLLDCLAEKFHTSEKCLAALNPGLDLASLAAGSRLRVPLRSPPPTSREVARLEIDLERKAVLILDSSEALVGLLHCSVAKDLSGVARGDCAVATVVADPGYTFDPRKWPEVKDVDRKLSIPPGPRSPVGIRWIGLDRPGVGIHGTPQPENIGKTGSHGCFRLTNWDAVHLASLVSVGTRVRILDRSPLAGECFSGPTAVGSLGAYSR